MSKITVLNEKAIAVNIPEYQFHLLGSRLFYKEPMDRHFEHVVLPSGQWSLLGRPKEITEEQWKGIVDTYPDDGCGGFAYMDYTSCVNGFETAKESGLDLLKSKGLNPESIIILIKQ